MKTLYLLLASIKNILKSSSSCWIQYVAIDIFVSDNVEDKIKLEITSIYMKKNSINAYGAIHIVQREIKIRVIKKKLQM